MKKKLLTLLTCNSIFSIHNAEMQELVRIAKIEEQNAKEDVKNMKEEDEQDLRKHNEIKNTVYNKYYNL